MLFNTKRISDNHNLLPCIFQTNRNMIFKEQLARLSAKSEVYKNFIFVFIGFIKKAPTHKE